ncbi:MAG: methylenetetrahydrofolate--tRNA-(uracil(54)-C(5))-methyltransferase (FADH(2)-oxidizing) TrmFO [Pseudomonadota bacterium]
MKKSSDIKPVDVIGGGLAGSEAAWQIAQAGVPVRLFEMRPVQGTPAHHTGGLAELVCSNSFRSDDWENNAVGLLHEEMRRAGSLIMAAGDRHKLPAGGALAVDRDHFSQCVTDALEAHPLVTIERTPVEALPPPDAGPTIIATGPLTSSGLSAAIQAETGQDELAFFDAIAPVLHADSIDMQVAWRQSRYDKAGPGGSGADYLNCPLDEAQYNALIDALLSGAYTDFKDWEADTPYFDGCLPIEVMAARGRETLRFGPMKPVGLTNPHTPVRPYAVVQLRQDNALGTLWNMVGFQTKLKHAEQTRIFRMIPGLEGAEFARLGGLHRNTFLNAPVLLTRDLRLRTRPQVRFAGQITGVEGYVESAAIGLLAGRFARAEALGIACPMPPAETALGALINHITGGHLSDSGEHGEAAAASADEGDGEAAPRSRARSFQPMNINYGLLPPMAPPRTDADGKRLKGKARTHAKKRLMSRRALAALEPWLLASQVGDGDGALQLPIAGATDHTDKGDADAGATAA